MNGAYPAAVHEAGDPHYLNELASSLRYSDCEVGIALERVDLAGLPLDPNAAPTEPYLDRVPVRVNLAPITGPVHVALLVTPWSYTTYRGS